MGISRRTFCGILFWIKASIAFLAGAGFLAYMSWRIANMYAIAYRNKPSLATSVSIPDAGCPVVTSDLARLEPPAGVQMLGFHLDWSKMTPIQLKGILGFAPAIVNGFLQLDSTASPPINWAMFDWHGQEARRVSAVLQMTIEPSRSPSEIDTIPESILDAIAQQCLAINTKYGTPILLRYGHEMNGDWTQYGLRPTAYKLGFQRMANAIRKVTNMTAMVWGPNLGVNYPFQNGGIAMPARGTVDFTALDSNNDGVIDYKDDPYTPYYPGDDYVDWVGLSLYWYPDAGTGFNGLPDATFFADQMTSQGPSVLKYQPVCNGQANKNFYANFPVARKKPMIVAETSAPWIPAITTSTTTQALAKQTWWRQIFGSQTIKNYPRIRAAVWFEETKSDDGLQVRDWQVTKDAATLAAFQADFTAYEKNKQVLLAKDFSINCNGQITIP
ncbi:glycoside hydrolase superfamily [Gorgonomyces haynaldii]|nr:glycoside hydrolase superfamily [Gorgonomyces haynaldii]